MAAAAANVPSSVSATYALPPGADVTKFHCLYPVYLDKSKTLAEGRRLPLSQAVPSPTIGEILMVAQQARIPMAIEVSYPAFSNFRVCAMYV
jgi:signal recognition particle subunit SRP19